MQQILTPISPGELLDKLTILEIKCAEITDPDKLANVRLERELLQEVADTHLPDSAELASLSNALLDVNRQLWQIEDEIRDSEHSGAFGDTFILLARSVYVTNDRRADLKRQINKLLGSQIVEEKSYTAY